MSWLASWSQRIAGRRRRKPLRVRRRSSRFREPRGRSCANLRELPMPTNTSALWSKLSQRHFFDQVIGALAQDEVGAGPRRQDVLTQVLQVDVAPQALGDGARGIPRKLRIAVEEGVRVAEGGLAQAHETLDVPLVDQLLVGIDVDGEVE